MMQNTETGPIGVFDSGYGGLTILREIRKLLPEYDCLYLGDNARAPYGSRSFDIIYDYTLSAVRYLFEHGCHLVILACNTASAKALRTIQQKWLPCNYPDRRVLGVIRPTVEIIRDLTHTGHIGVAGTTGTVASGSYSLEIKKLFPDMVVTEKACPLWVPLIENREYESEGTDFFVEKYLNELFLQDPMIDTLLLACTHYPILLPKIRKFVPGNISIISQGTLVAESLKDYLKRHTEIDMRCGKNASAEFLTSENAEKFNELASIFLNSDVRSRRISL